MAFPAAGERVFANPSMMTEPDGSMEELVCIFCGGEAELTGR